MKNYETEMIKLFSFKEKCLKATFHRPKDKDIKATILYFHGGGLVFGDRDDLPEKYIELLTASGLAIFAVDYPLAPETKMPEILESAVKITDYFVHHFLPKINVDHYFMMGRSAGGFLTLSTGVSANTFKNKPLGLISLYGYYNLNDALFSVPNRYYLKYPKVNDQLISSLTHKEEVVTKGERDRFLVYLSSRQKGDWMNLLLTSTNQKREFSLTKNQINELPPLFLAAAQGDNDVPSRQSQQLANIHSNAQLTLYDLYEHDFDRTHQETVGIELYKKIIEWVLENI